MRKFIRHNSGIPVDITHEKNQYKFMLLNVSMGGMACKGSREFAVSTDVQVCIPLLRPEYTASGRVVWCKKIPDSTQGEMYEVGIENYGEKDKARLRMVEQVSHIEHYRNEVKISEERLLTGEEAAREWVSKYSGE